MLKVIDGNATVDLKDLGLSCLSFQVEPLEANHETDNVEGADGYADIETSYNGRKLYSRWLFQVGSYDVFHDKKDKIYSLFAPKKELILIDERQSFKQWTARVESQARIDNDEGAYYKEFEVSFFSKNVYANAVEPYAKTFIENQFVVFNDGTETIDAREHELLIKFKGASDKLRIRNETTGEQWQYLDATVSGDEILLDQVYPYKNGKNIFSDTNHGALTIIPGANNFRLYGTSDDYEIIFEFQPLYI